MKMIIELNAAEAKNAVKSGALLTMLDVMVEFEKETEAPARNFVNSFKEATIKEGAIGQPQTPMQPQTPIQPQQPQQPQPQQSPIQQPQQVPAQQAPAVVPTAAAPTYSFDQLAVAATQLVDAGKMDVLHGILNNFGISALTELPKNRYGEFATMLRQNGVKI